MSPLARVATLAAITIGTAAALAAPAAAEPSAPTSPLASDSPSAPSSPSGTATPLGTPTFPTASTSPTVSAQDTQYLQQAHQTNLAEIAAGRLAQQKGNQTVKNLGARFVTDHTKLDQALKQVAQSLGVSLPQAPNANQQAVGNRLKAVSGSQFNTLFVTSQFAGHTQAMQAGQNEIANGSNPQVIALARQAAPVIAAHHQALQAAAQQLNIPLPTASMSTISPSLPVSPSQSMHS